MTAAARLARSLRHRLGDALIGWGARLTHDAGPELTPDQEARIRRAVEAGRAVLEAGRREEAIAAIIARRIAARRDAGEGES